jgi:rod shape-determining protein MreD
MRNTAFLALGAALLVLQSNLFRFFGLFHQLGELVGAGGAPTRVFGFFEVTPSLLLPLVVFMGVHEYSMARGAALSFTLGYLHDVFAGSPPGLFTFITVATFVVSRAAGVRLAAQTLITKFGLALVFALVQGVLIVVLTAIFGNDPNDPARPLALAMHIVPHAVVTAICAPAIFWVAERVHNATIGLPGAASEGAAR